MLSSKIVHDFEMYRYDRYLYRSLAIHGDINERKKIWHFSVQLKVFLMFCSAGVSMNHN